MLEWLTGLRLSVCHIGLSPASPLYFYTMAIQQFNFEISGQERRDWFVRR